MSKIKNYLDEIANCDTCYAKGWLYYGNDEDYNIDPCVCNPLSLEYNELVGV